MPTGCKFFGKFGIRPERNEIGWINPFQNLDLTCFET
jgi:hypothetical protein